MTHKRRRYRVVERAQQTRPTRTDEYSDNNSCTDLFRVLAVVPVLLGLVTVSLFWGSVQFAFSEVARVLVGPVSNEIVSIVVRTVRVPRIAAAVAVGAALSVSGLVMQTVFRNALAGPGVLGVGSGAGFGVAVVLLTGIGSDLFLPVGIAAIIGASSVLLLALVVNRLVGEPVVLLVLGLLFGYAASAGTTVLMASSRSEGLERYITWSFGSFALPPDSGQTIVLLAVIVAAVFFTLVGPRIDALLLGAQYAESSGISASRYHALLIGTAGALTGLVTALAGPITFLGVAVPHLARGWIGSSRHRVLVPATCLIGASLAVAADLVARMPWSDRALPLNAVTALIGVPVVLSVLFGNRGGRGGGGLGL